MKLFVILSVFVSTLAQAQGTTPLWMSQKYRASIAGILKNVNPTADEPGTVIASPSQKNPPYYFHWVRDAALVMNNVIDLYILDTNIKNRERWNKLLVEYAERARKHQLAKAKTGLGEPKFNLDGTAFDGPWGRPQYDGPALRAAVFTRLAAIWLQQGKRELVEKYLWNPKKPQESLIRTDLEFTLQIWNKPSFDLWEESLGIHFFTMVAQRKALRIGARLAQALGEHQDSRKYLAAYRTLTAAMEQFWNPTMGRYVASLNKVGGIDYKVSNLDSSLFIAVNFAESTDGSVGQIDDPRLIRTFVVTEKVFSDLYPINYQRRMPPMIGRYPEDKYNGVGNSYGNPWFITTHAFGEYLYKLASFISARGAITVNSLTHEFFKQFGEEIKEEEIIKVKDKRFKKILAAIFKRADGYLASAQHHTGPSFRMAEQVNRNTGYQQGAPDLTWSYASYVSAYFARHRVYQSFRSHLN